MREEIGGVDYTTPSEIAIWFAGKARGLGSAQNPSPRAELLLHLKTVRNET
jgi:hypothetical protein